MKRFLAILTILVVGTALTIAANPDDVNDIKMVVQAVYSALKAKDAGAIAQYMHPQHSQFLPGEPLTEGFDQEHLKAFLGSEVKVDLETRHLGVKIYGNTAIVTGYEVGTVWTFGGITKVTNQLTQVWIKQEGKWKQVHSHASPLHQRQ